MKLDNGPGSTQIFLDVGGIVVDLLGIQEPHLGRQRETYQDPIDPVQCQSVYLKLF